MAEDDFGFLEHRGAGPGGEQFVVVIAKVLQMARLQEVQAVVRCAAQLGSARGKCGAPAAACRMGLATAVCSAQPSAAPRCRRPRRNKFGPHGMRIWRLLLLQGQLEQKQVADLAMVPKEEAREKLYAMLKAG